MVGGDLIKPEECVTTSQKMMPKGVSWTELAVSKIDPQNNTLTTEDGAKFTYDQLVIATGIQNNYDSIKGFQEALDDPQIPVSTIYQAKYAQKWCKLMKEFNGKHAVFAQPPMPIKCPGAPQKIMHLSHDHWYNEKKISPKIDFYTPLPFIFGVPKYAQVLQKLADEKNIPVHLAHTLIEIRGKERVAVFKDNNAQKNVEVPFDILNATPAQRTPDFIRETVSIIDATGFVDVDPATLRSTKFSNIWALGDCSNTPNSKTAAAIMAQTPVMVHNLLESCKKSEPKMAAYQGYASCPIFVGQGKVLLAEFKYKGELDETFPSLQHTPQFLFKYFKTHLFPFVYFHFMPRGIWYGRNGFLKPKHFFV